MWTACLWWRGCRAVSGEENVKGLEIQNILGYRHHLKFDVCLVVTGGMALSYTEDTSQIKQKSKLMELC
jgi:hypothetical protein